MKVHASLFFCTCALGLALIASNMAQNGNAAYNLAPRTFSGGGGTSHGGSYAVSGSIGLPDAGPVLSGGAYSLRGGFWNMQMAIAATGEIPSIVIEHSSNDQILIRWAAQGGDWILQQTETLPGGWTSAVEPVTSNGAEEAVVISPSGRERFFRLTKP